MNKVLTSLAIIGLFAAPANADFKSDYIDAIFGAANYDALSWNQQIGSTITKWGIDTSLDLFQSYMDAFGTEINAFTSGFESELRNKLDEQSKDISSGVAAANALAGLDNHLDAGKIAGFGVGTGYYDSQAAVALGGIIRTTGASALNAGVAFGKQGSVSAKAGWNMQF